MNICPVCSYDKLKSPAYENIESVNEAELYSFAPPYEVKLGKPSYEVCPKCGYEFGNDDNPGTSAGISFADYHTEWEASGSKWFDDFAK